jgi:pyruvate dehydrogenase complex dehydrogenase (E1) component
MLTFIPSTHESRNSTIKHWPPVEFSMTVSNTKQNDIAITEDLENKILWLITWF